MASLKQSLKSKNYQVTSFRKKNNNSNCLVCIKNSDLCFCSKIPWFIRGHLIHTKTNWRFNSPLGVIFLRHSYKFSSAKRGNMTIGFDLLQYYRTTSEKLFGLIYRNLLPFVLFPGQLNQYSYPKLQSKIAFP